MRHPKVLFVMEGGGTLPQDYVRGIIYRDMFTSSGIIAHYVGNHIAPPDYFLRPRSKFAQRCVGTFEYSVLWVILSRIGRYFNQRRIIFMSRHYDAIVFVKVSSLDLIKKVRQNSRARLIYDHSDALWLPHYAKTYKHIRDILRIVDAVTWDYVYTCDFIKQFNENIFHWPAPSQVELFDRNRGQCNKKKDEITIGWVGSQTTLFNLYSVWEALEQIFAKHKNVILKLIGTGTNSLLIPNFERVKYSGFSYYSQQEMINEILSMDIGLFPLFDVEDSRVRGFLKALVYMSGEAAVIASPRGQVPELIQDGVNGMLANSTAEWVEKLDLLISDHVLRKRIATAGLETARRDFSLEKSFECLLTALNLKKIDGV